MLIVAVTQYLLQYLVLVPALSEAGYSPSLDNFHFFLLVLTTVLIAAGGYIINDIMDYETDLINKPEKMVLGKNISINKATLLYLLISMLGLEIAWILAKHVENRGLVLIYPAAVFLLYFYSKNFKKLPLLGNVLVSLFCAGVAGIVLFAERDIFAEILKSNHFLGNKITILFGGYIVFAFISTMLREVVKDMEDIEGDRASGLRTYPIYAGIKKARDLSIYISSIMAAGLFVFIFWLLKNNETPGAIFTFLFLILPLLYILKILFKSENKKQFARLSKLTKLVMLSGLLLLIAIWIFSIKKYYALPNPPAASNCSKRPVSILK